jgi:hypothetical protein
MSVTAISPVSFLNATSLINPGPPQAPSSPQESAQKTPPEASNVSSSTPPQGSSPTGNAIAVQAFTAFAPAVQPIAGLIPATDVPPPLPVNLGTDSSASTQQWSAVTLDVYA